MAKVKFTQNVAGMSGKIGEGVYMFSSKQGLGYTRPYVYPSITQNNTLMGSQMKNIAKVYSSVTQEYKDDLSDYAVEYHALALYSKPNSERAYSPYAIFVKMMYALQLSDPAHIDLATITLSDLKTLGVASCVGAQVDAGYLPVTPDSKTYDNLMWT